jgi:hypothetical protein
MSNCLWYQTYEDNKCVDPMCPEQIPASHALNMPIIVLPQEERNYIFLIISIIMMLLAIVSILLSSYIGFFLFIFIGIIFLILYLFVPMKSQNPPIANPPPTPTTPEVSPTQPTSPPTTTTPEVSPTQPTTPEVPSTQPTTQPPIIPPVISPTQPPIITPPVIPNLTCGTNQMSKTDPKGNQACISCRPKDLPYYECMPKTGCQHVKQGTITSLNECQDNCKLYSCNNTTKQCELSNTGEYTSISDCQGNCMHIAPIVIPPLPHPANYNNIINNPSDIILNKFNIQPAITDGDGISITKDKNTYCNNTSYPSIVNITRKNDNLYTSKINCYKNSHGNDNRLLGNLINGQVYNVPVAEGNNWHLSGNNYTCPSGSKLSFNNVNGNKLSILCNK